MQCASNPETCAPSPICFSMSAASSGVARWQNPRIREAGLEERDDHKHKQDPSDGRDAAGEVLHQERAAGTTQRLN